MGREQEVSKENGGFRDLSSQMCKYSIPDKFKRFNCCLIFDYVLYLYSKLCRQKFLYRFKLLLFSSQTGAKCKIFELTVSNHHLLVCS